MHIADLVRNRLVFVALFALCFVTECCYIKTNILYNIGYVWLLSPCRIKKEPQIFSSFGSEQAICYGAAFFRQAAWSGNWQAISKNIL